MNVTMEHNGERAVIRVPERFDFDHHREFRAAATEALNAEGVREVVVDLAVTTYLDSSALGMLLVLRDRAAEVQKAVVVANCQGTVQQVMAIANFPRLFRFE